MKRTAVFPRLFVFAQIYKYIGTFSRYFTLVSALKPEKYFQKA